MAESGTVFVLHMAPGKPVHPDHSRKGRVPAPRKLPSQSRSRSLVSALIEACIRVLEEEGSEALTVNRLAEVSGVAVGSFYQYFPNIEALLGQTFEHVLREEAAVSVPALRASVAGLPLEGALREILQNMVRTELRLHRLHAEFHLKYHPELQMGMRIGPYASSREFVDDAWRPFVTLYAPELEPERADMAAYMLCMAMRSVIRAALEDAPERVGQAAFLDCLLAMALGMLDPRLPTREQQDRAGET